ncbi:MAG: molybdopterin-dependent oxidoreductase [Jatrophihabitans sp.]|uniref:molybdopterin-dependent oxidoreductase n=1 Tax=Jatrophihabitans sp. TaxID=1932789 RepID=UPI003F807D68
MRSRNAVGALIGLLSAGIALGVGELVAAFVRPEASPVIAVGNRLITLTPGDVARASERSVGTNDKPLLVVGIIAVTLVFGAVVGQWALRDRRWGLVGIGIFGAAALYCAITADASRGTDVIPTIVATAAAAVTLLLLVRAAGGDTRTTPTAGVDRRAVLRAGAATAAVAAVSAVVGRSTQSARFDVSADRAKVTLPPPTQAAAALPAGVDLRKGAPWATPSGSFYRIDRALTIPQIASGDWVLRIHGLVDKPMTLRYDDLLARPLMERWVTLCCVSNPVGGPLVGNALWRGAHLADILREAGVQPEADQILFTGAEGTTIGAPTAAIMDGRDAMLAVGMNGAPLPIEHGFPVRVVIPGLYGYVSACKWVIDLKATTFASEAAYWVDNGWDQRTPIILTSRIDSPKSGRSISKGETVYVAGVAWDQHVGVSKVEVQVNDGPWRAATLAAVPSTDTWRQWVLPWTPEQSGSYRLRVRATDAQGNVQTDAAADPGPGGATGLHAITVQVTA